MQFRILLDLFRGFEMKGTPENVLACVYWYRLKVVDSLRDNIAVPSCSSHHSRPQLNASGFDFQRHVKSGLRCWELSVMTIR